MARLPCIFSAALLALTAEIPAQMTVEVFDPDLNAHGAANQLEVEVAVSSITPGAETLEVSEDPQFTATLAQVAAEPQVVLQSEVWLTLPGISNADEAVFALSPAGDLIAVAMEDELAIFNVQTGAEIRRIDYETPLTISGHPTGCAFTADGTAVVVFSFMDFPPMKFDVQTGQKLRQLSPGFHGARPDYSPSADRFFAPDEARSWSLSTGAQRTPFSPGLELLMQLGVSRDGSRIGWFGLKDGIEMAGLSHSDDGTIDFEGPLMLGQHPPSMESNTLVSPDNNSIFVVYGQLDNFGSNLAFQEIDSSGPSGTLDYVFPSNANYQVGSPSSAGITSDGSLLWMTEYGVRYWIWQRGVAEPVVSGRPFDHIPIADFSLVAAQEEGTILAGSFISDDSTFEIRRLWLDRSGSQTIPVTLSEGSDGVRDVHVRALSDTQPLETASGPVNLDRAAPEPPDDVIWIPDSGKFVWSRPSDNPGGSGISDYEIQYAYDLDPLDIYPQTLTSEIEEADPSGNPTSYLFGKGRSRDNAGNWSTWSDWGTVPAVLSNLVITPNPAYSIDTITATCDVFDPDGDEVTLTWRWNGQDLGPVLTPAMTERDQVFRVLVNAVDEHGARTKVGLVEPAFEILNSPPTPPVIELLPDPYVPGSDMAVNILEYSTDADGDTVNYDFEWFESQDGGNTWIRKAELSGEPVVNALFIDPNELWRVELTPVDTPAKNAPRGTALPANAGWDQIHTGSNTAPRILSRDMTALEGPGGHELSVTWEIEDPDAEAVAVSIYRIDETTVEPVPVVQNVPAGAGAWNGTEVLPKNRTVQFRLVATDAKGATTQVSLKQVDTREHDLWLLR